MIDLREPWECRWPKGCAAPISLCDGRDLGLCYLHAKTLAGLIDAPFMPKYRAGVPRSDVVSDEQREVAEALRVLGAPSWVIERAFARELSIGLPKTGTREQKSR